MHIHKQLAGGRQINKTLNVLDSPNYDRVSVRTTSPYKKKTMGMSKVILFGMERPSAIIINNMLFNCQVGR